MGPARLPSLLPDFSLFEAVIRDRSRRGAGAPPRFADLVARLLRDRPRHRVHAVGPGSLWAAGLGLMPEVWRAAVVRPSRTTSREPLMSDAKVLRGELLASHRDALRGLHRLQPFYNLKIVAFFATWAVGVALALQGPVGWAPGWLLATAGLLGNAILMHDAAHHLLARDHRWNRWLGFVCGAPALISTTAYRLNHIEHHAVTGTDDDSGDPVAHAHRTGWSVASLVKVFLVFGTFLVVPGVATGAWRKADPAQRRQIAVEYGLIAAGLALAVAIAPWPWLLHGWVAPFLLGSVANNVRSLAEHAYTDRADSLRNARTVLGGPVLNLVQSNVNYHWEHHLFPGVPWYHLPARHRLLGDERARIGVPTEPGYASWMVREVWPSLWSRP